MKTIHAILAASALVSVAASTGCGGQTYNQKLVGRWVSASCEPAGPNLYVKRDFTITESTWQLNVVLFNDAACAAKFVGIDVGGGYQVKQDSASVPGATEVDYLVGNHSVTPYSDPAVQTLTQGKCGSGPWAIGTKADVTQTGCTPLQIPSVATCPMEFDLNKIDGNNLYFGDRSSDLCKARPGKLGALPVVKMP